MALVVLSLGALVALLAGKRSSAPIPQGPPVEFADVSARVGLDLSPSFSWSIAWGDAAGDDDPDLWLGNHFERGQYFLNAQGSFELRFETEKLDTHGIAWADFDNDGDRDLIELTGANVGRGQSANRLFLNVAGEFVESAKRYGIDHAYGRGRRPLWLDYDHDGDLDLLVLNFARADGRGESRLLRNDGERFVNVTAHSGLRLRAPGHDVAGLLSDLAGDGRLDLIVFDVGGRHNPVVYTLAGHRFFDNSHNFDFGATPMIKGALTRDFNNDLKPALLLARYAFGVPAIVRRDDRTLVAYLPGSAQPEVRFGAEGAVAFEIWVHQDAIGIYLGSEGREPDFINTGADRRYPLRRHMVLHPSDPAVAGFPASPHATPAVFIGFDAERGEWRLRATSRAWMLARIVMTSKRFGEVQLNSAFDRGPAQTPQLFLSGFRGYRNATEASGLAKPLACASAGAGDFDNDMDVDIYFVCTGLISNRPNVIAWNDGRGRFVLSSAVGAESSDAGRGDEVAIADYDRDGFLDLFVSNGEGGLPFASGPGQLFRNRGNSNNWIEITLAGTRSNRDGIGAVVLVKTAQGRQLREQQAGMNMGG